MAYKKRINFRDSEEGTSVEEALVEMVADVAFRTEPSYTANQVAYPDNLIPFVEKHMSYLHHHPDVDSKGYLSNLRLLTRLR